MATTISRAALLLGAALLAGCDDAPEEPAPEPGGHAGHGGHDHPQLLSEWGFFADGPAQVPAEGVIPYDVNAPLFSDHTLKHRFFRLPEGARVTYDDTGRWVFPEGAVLVKTFSYPRDARDPSLGERLLETRLLVRTAGAYTVHTFVWNEAQTDAEHVVAGARIPVSWIDAGGVEQSLEYRVPNTNQCLGCHGGSEYGVTDVLGPRTRQLNRLRDFGDGPVNQIDHFDALGLLDRTPPPAGARETLPEPFSDLAPLEARARAYLEANCAHCHYEDGAAGSSGLHLGLEVEQPGALGVCKVPFAAGEGTGGHLYDIVPGRPEESILVFRMRSVDPNIKMPELPAQLADTAGADLVAAWIDAMTPEGCP